MCLVFGEAGIGKTSLLRLASTRHETDARWLWGSCDPLATPRPLGPLHDFARRTGGALAERLFTGAPRESSFLGLLDAIDDERRPTVLVIDDLHWADQATLDLVLFVGRRIADRPVVLIASYRDDESGSDPLFRATVGALPRDLVHRIPLAPLSQDGVAALATRLGRSAAGIHEATAGNPFFVTEMLAGDGLQITPTIRDAVLARTRLLSPAARETLDLVATMPRAPELDFLERQLGVDLGALGESISAGLLVAEGRTVAFRHELARRAIESAADPLRRRAMHARVLDALISGAEMFGDVPLARIIHHALAVGDSNALRRFAPPAAREAAAASAHREALRYYELALEHSAGLTAEQCAELLEGKSIEAYLCGLTNEAIDARQQALDIWRAAARTDRAGAALRWLSRLHWWAGDPDRAERAADESVRILETLPPAHELAMAISNKAQLHMLAQRDEAAVEWGERAVALARALGDVEALSHALNNTGSARLRLGDRGGRALLEEAFSLAADAGLDDHASRALVNLGNIPLDAREYADAAPGLDRALAYAEAHDLDAYARYLAGQRARLRMETGDWVTAERDARDVLSRDDAAGVTTIPALLVLGTIQLRRGDPDADATLTRTRALAYPTRELQRVGPTAAALAEHAWLAGDLATVIAEAEPALEAARSVKQEWLIGELAMRLRLAGREVDALHAAEPWRLYLEGNWRASADAWKALGCPYERAEALACGDERAMNEALSIFDALGAARRAGVLRRAMRERGLRVPVGPRRTTRANRAGLTSRQMDVLRLVDQGRTNQEIAERLNLAPKTVDHHVSAVLEKLGVSTRRAAGEAARRIGVLGDSE